MKTAYFPIVACRS